MPLVQTRTSAAADLILRMKKLLAERHSNRMGRRAFLNRWSKLREALTLTYEYQAWRQRVIERDGGKCQGCGRETRTCHHKKQVSRAPQLVLDLDNGELRCTDCHKKLHRCLRRHAA